MSAPCPACAETVFRRRKGCCPYCGEKLIPHGGKLYRESEWGSAAQVHAIFARELMTYSIVFHQSKGSSAWRNQIAYASQLLETTREYLRACHEGGIGVNNFAIQYVRDVMRGRAGKWIAENPSIIRLLGNTFTINAGQVLKKMRADMELQRANERFAVTEDELLPDMLRLG